MNSMWVEKVKRDRAGNTIKSEKVQYNPDEHGTGVLSIGKVIDFCSVTIGRGDVRSNNGGTLRGRIISVESSNGSVRVVAKTLSGNHYRLYPKDIERVV